MIQTPAQTTAIIRLKIPKAKIQQEMGPGLNELQSTVAAQGAAASGPWFTHHLKITAEAFDFEICVSVSKPVSPVGRVEASQRPSMKVAQTVYHGDFSGLADAWGALDAWIKAQGLTPADDLWECYLVGPESDPNPSAWRTQLSRPLLG